MPQFGIVFLILIAIIVFIIWLISLIDILKSKNDSNWKLLWAIVVIFLSILGTIIYWSIGKKEREQ